MFLQIISPNYSRALKRNNHLRHSQLWSPVRRREHKVSKFSKPTLKKGVLSLLGEAKHRVVEEATRSKWKEFLKILVLIKGHKWVQVCAHHNHIFASEIQKLYKRTLQLILSLLGTMSNHCPSTGLHGPDEWGESSHNHPLHGRSAFQSYHLTAHTVTFKVQEL